LAGLTSGAENEIGFGFSISGETQTVTILASHAGFDPEPECGRWFLAPTNGAEATTFGPGAWIVGVDIAPGTYRGRGGSDYCHWDRLSGLDGDILRSTIEIGNFDDRTGVTERVVTIGPTDVGFWSSVGCGTWPLFSEPP
jgi:hypothetical protein